MNTTNRRLRIVLAASAGSMPCLFGSTESDSQQELDQSQSDIVEPLIAKNVGHVLRSCDDAFLAEFVSAVNAVSFAIEMQKSFAARNAEYTGENQVSFRIGIDLWDTTLGQKATADECVKVAIRLQALAEPGDILISDTVYKDVYQHMPISIQDAGKHQLTEVSELVPTYRVVNSKSLQHDLSRNDQFQSSVAVLPFENMSGDPEQEYLSDGITDDIISRLSAISALFVVSRDVVYTYKGTTEKYSQLALTLGIQYVLQGGVKKFKDQLLIRVVLIDGHTHGQIWANSYACSFPNIIELQGQISHDIVDVLHLRVLPKERDSLSRRSTDNSEAYRFYLMGRSYFHLSHTRRSLRLAKQMFQQALDIDPHYAAAHAGVADCCAHLIEAGDFTISAADVVTHTNPH